MIKIWILVTISVIGCYATDDTFDETVHKGHWLTCKTDETATPAANFDPKWYQEQFHTGWYYVMGNQWHIITLTKALTGVGPKDKESIKHACFTNQHNGDGFHLDGYGNKADYKCGAEIGGGIRKECVPTEESTNATWAASRGTTESVIVWTDNKKYILGVRCTGMIQSWGLRSTENVPVDEVTKRTVMETIIKLGFKIEDAVEIPREGCPLLKPGGRSVSNMGEGGVAGRSVATNSTELGRSAEPRSVGESVVNATTAGRSVTSGGGNTTAGGHPDGVNPATAGRSVAGAGC